MPPRSLPAILLALLPAAALAQGTADIRSAISGLNNPLTRAQAAERLRDAPESAAPELWAALENPNTREEARAALSAALDALRDRVYYANREAEATDWHALFLAHGRKDPASDALVARAFDVYRSGSNWASTPAFKAALDAGCDDPMVLYFFARVAVNTPNQSATHVMRIYDRAAREIIPTSYPAHRKFFAQIRFLEHAANFPTLDELTRRRQIEAFDAALEYFPQAAGGPGKYIANKESCNIFLKVALHLFPDRQEAFNRLFPALEKAVPQAEFPLAVKAELYNELAWRARGSRNLEDPATPQQLKQFNEFLALGRQAAQKGWDAAPLEWGCATAMLKMCLADPDRAAMEKWFARAHLNRPDESVAAWHKFLWLRPDHHGNREECLEFARWCARNGGVNTPIPTILSEAHTYFRSRAPDPLEYNLKSEFWPDMRQLYDRLIAAEDQRPETYILGERARYLKAAVDAQRWDVLLALMERFGDEINFDTFGGKTRYDFYKRKAQAHVARAAGTAPRPG